MSASREKKKRQEQVNAPASAETQKGMSKGLKKVLYTVIALVLVAAIVFLGLVSSGFFTTHTTAGIANGHKLTPAMLNYYYTNAYQQSSSILGYLADPEKPLDQQPYMSDEFETWHDYLVDYALSSAASTYAMYDEAIANGFTMSEEAKASLDSNLQMLELSAAMNGASSADAYVAANYGTGCNVKSYTEFLTVNYTAQEYATQYYNGLSYTQEEMDAYYAENAGNFDSVSFYQFNLTAEQAEGEEAPSEEALAAAEEKAKAMADAANRDEAKFLELCTENTAEDKRADYDPSSTLREDVAENDCIEAIRDWLADDARQPGDTTCVYNTTNGYYVLYFVEQVDHSYLLPNVRYILIGVEDTTNTTAMEEAKAKAEGLLDEFLAGDATEEAFAALANENSTDPGSNTNGGLYEDIAPGEMAAAFDDWCFDEARQVGDTGIVETNHGYHIMYFSGFGETTYHDYEVKTEMIDNAFTEWRNGVTADLSWELKSDRFMTTR